MFGRPASIPDGYRFVAIPDPATRTTKITFPTVVGRSYRVLWSETLLAADWQEGSPSFSGTGGSGEWTDVEVGSKQRFYRIEATVLP